ncbi:MAG TPA: ribonucleoside-diphosphate reductase subunit alpha [Candidatus Dojkabacteria bacterium]|nr:ribonucleoside-diphosphate reductase subunit alpha [Candidatus Dojkabacteria bacterium]
MMAINTVRKRNGEVVVFNKAKIELAVSKAFKATNTRFTPRLITTIVDQVLNELEKSFNENTIPHVENIQDLVEQKIADNGYFNVAKAYIIYRAEHAKERGEQTIKQGLQVKKRNGIYVSFDLNEIEKALDLHSDKKPLPKDELFAEIKNAVFDGIATKEVTQLIIMALRARIERDQIYSDMAARFLFNDLYKDIIGVDEADKDFQKIYREKFVDQIKYGIKDERLEPKLAKFDLKKISAALEPTRDHLFEYLGAQVIWDRYLMRDSNDKTFELPQYFWMRIAMGLALNEGDNKTERAIEFYNLISQMLYVPSTPTLFHSGSTHPQMSSCYLTTVQDDLEDIFKSYADNAQLSKWSGGLGNDWTNIRGTGAWIKTTNVPSQGVIPFLKISDATTAAINRSGKRRGAAAIYLETWHYDIESFLELRKNTGDERRRTHDSDTVNWIPDLFMKRVLSDDVWTLFSSDETPDLHHLYGKAFDSKYEEYERMAKLGQIKLFKQIPAKELWRKMITMLFETGHPWMTFKDPCNIRSPQDHVGVVHSSNLCTEITLNTSKDEVAVCNLGSINLARHIKDSKLNKQLLESTIKLGIRMLDNVIDINHYPIPEAKNSNMKHRPIGLGVMGYQDALYMMDIPFDSEEAVEFSDHMMETISYNAILASSELAKERGTYSSYKGSKWDRGIFPVYTIKLLEDERGIETKVSTTSELDWKKVKASVKKYGMRNSNCMALAPTATISNISGCFPTIEPIYKNLYVKSNFSGEFTVINSYLIEDLKKVNMWNDDTLNKIKHYNGSIQQISEIPVNIRAKYKEAFEIDPIWVIKQAAYRGKWIDQSQSVNIFTSSTSGQQISDIYIAAWKYGLKTTYYIRTLGASSIEKSTIDINKKYEAKSEVSEANQLPVKMEVEIKEKDAVINDTVISEKEEVVVTISEKEINPKLCRIDDPNCEACQ